MNAELEWVVAGCSMAIMGVLKASGKKLPKVCFYEKAKTMPRS